MSSHELRSDVRSLVRSHFGAYRNFRTGILTPGAVAEVVMPPVVVGAASGAFAVGIGGPIAAALVVACAAAAAVFMFALLGISQSAMRWHEHSPEKGRETSSRATLLTETAASCGYAALIGTAAAIAFAVSAMNPTGITQTIATTIGLMLCAHMLITAGMIMKRLFSITTATLDRIRGGV